MKIKNMPNCKSAVKSMASSSFVVSLLFVSVCTLLITSNSSSMFVLAQPSPPTSGQVTPKKAEGFIPFSPPPQWMSDVSKVQPSTPPSATSPLVTRDTFIEDIKTNLKKVAATADKKLFSVWYQGPISMLVGVGLWAQSGTKNPVEDETESGHNSGLALLDNSIFTDVVNQCIPVNGVTTAKELADFNECFYCLSFQHLLPTIYMTTRNISEAKSSKRDRAYFNSFCREELEFTTWANYSIAFSLSYNNTSEAQWLMDSYNVLKEKKNINCLKHLGALYFDPAKVTDSSTNAEEEEETEENDQTDTDGTEKKNTTTTTVKYPSNGCFMFTHVPKGNNSPAQQDYISKDLSDYEEIPEYKNYATWKSYKVDFPYEAAITNTTDDNNSTTVTTPVTQHTTTTTLAPASAYTNNNYYALFFINLCVVCSSLFYFLLL